MSYPPLSVKVSECRTGQDASILKLAPRFMSKGEGQLIDGQGEQVSKFAHQVGFRQTLRCKGEGDLTACWLPKEAALIGIEAQFEHLVAKG